MSLRLMRRNPIALRNQHTVLRKRGLRSRSIALGSVRVGAKGLVSRLPCRPANPFARTLDNHQTSPVIELQISHRSIRRYTGEPIPDELLAALIRAGQGAASSSFIQAYSIIRVTRPAARAAIARAAGNQPWIEQAAEFLIFCADLRRVDAACRHAGAGPLEGRTEYGLAAVVDVALMAQNVLLAAESVGLGGVYIGGIRNDPETVVDQLQIPELVVPVFGLCLGWPAESPEGKPRQPLELILQALFRLVWAGCQTPWSHAAGVAHALRLKGDAGRWVSLPATR